MNEVREVTEVKDPVITFNPDEQNSQSNQDPQEVQPLEVLPQTNEVNNAPQMMLLGSAIVLTGLVLARVLIKKER